jgi:DNA-binding transcriptional LysR family regulator
MSVMDRLETMQVFVQVAERASFAEAARALSLPASRVTRAVAALEERCGARLLNRTTRVVRLTEAGTRYLAQCKQILSAIEEAEAQAASSQRELSGQLSITAPVLFGRHHVAPVLFAFLKEHPKLSARVAFVDRVVDMLEQQVDVAVRIGHLPDSGLTAIRVGHVRRVTVGAPSYLRTYGTPAHPQALREHALIAFAGMAEAQRWTYQIDGKIDTVAPTPRMIVNNGEIAIAAALAGHGLTKVLSYQVVDEVRAKRLKVILAPFEPEPTPVHVVHVEGRAASRRVRAFVEFAVQRLRNSLARANLS